MLPALLTSVLLTASYKTLSGLARYEEVIGKGSRFVAIAAPVKSAEDALAFVKEAADLKARHNCYAWRLRDGSMRTNADGEPGGTAGPPILAAVDGANLQDVAVIVSRYRMDGGAKLGTGGLVRAYGGTAAACLDRAQTVELQETSLMCVRYEAQDTGAVFQTLTPYYPKIVGPSDVGGDTRLLEQDDKMEASFEAKREEVGNLAAQLSTATQGRIQGVWIEGRDPDFPFPEFVSAADL